MQAFLRPTRGCRLPLLPRVRQYTPSPSSCRPTALHRAEEAADVKKHPESALTQEKRKDDLHNHHWTEDNSTTSEADVKADRDAIVEELGSEKVQEGINAFGERGFG